MRKIIIAIIYIILIFFATELFLRKADFDFITAIRIIHGGGDWREHQIFTDRDFIPDPYLFWKLNPENKLINSQGFVGSEFGAVKKNIFRIFCLGDSLTMGTKDYSYAGELRKLLAEKPFSSSQFEVINAGVSGYSSLQGLRLCSEIIKYHPDLVTVCFGWNDAAYTYRKPDKDFNPGNKYILTLQRILYRSRTGRFLRYLYFLFLKAVRAASLSNRGGLRVELRDYADNLVEMNRLLKEKNTRLLLITRPCIIGVEKQRWVIEFVNKVKAYNSLTKELALNCRIDLIDADNFCSVHPEYFLDSCHLNKIGNQLLAQEIYNYLKSNY